jgi:DeoR family transcriptional regulator, glycerol-3-phosphate regulon repressor
MQSKKNQHRHERILTLVRDRGTMSVVDLAGFCLVSAETIRRDAAALVSRGLVTKKHGSVGLVQQLPEAPFGRRMRENKDAKIAICKRAASLVADGDSVMLDTGTTTLYLAEALRDKRDLTVITNNPDIARMLSGSRVYLAGGEVSADNATCFGPATVEFVTRFKVKHGFISAAGVSALDGIMDFNLVEADFARAVLRCAEQGSVLVDASKFGKMALARVCGFDAVTRVITDVQPPDALMQAIHTGGATVDVVGTG